MVFRITTIVSLIRGQLLNVHKKRDSHTFNVCARLFFFVHSQITDPSLSLHHPAKRTHASVSLLSTFLQSFAQKKVSKWQNCHANKSAKIAFKANFKHSARFFIFSGFWQYMVCWGLIKHNKVNFQAESWQSIFSFSCSLCA